MSEKPFTNDEIKSWLKQEGEDGCDLSPGQGQCLNALQLILELEAALQPFADYVDTEALRLNIPGALFPPEHIITQGSSMARRQLTLGDCQRALEVLNA